MAMREKWSMSHLLPTRSPSYVRALLQKIGNSARAVRERLIDLHVVLSGGGRPHALRIVLQPAQQTHPGFRVCPTPVLPHALVP